MKLTEGQKNKAVEKLSGFLKSSCSVCQGKGWVLSDRIFELREFHGGTLVIGEKSATFPVIAVVCNSCGNTLFFNAIQLGIAERGEHA